MPIFRGFNSRFWGACPKNAMCHCANILIKGCDFMSKEKRLRARMCEVTADIDILTLEKVKSGLVTLADKIDKWCYLLHDKDTKDDGTPKHTHYHVYLRFNTTIDFTVIKKAFDVEIGNVQYIHSNNYDTACLYLVHKNQPEKYQYNPDDVVSSFNYPLFLKNAEKKMSREAKLKQLREGIEEGTINRFNLDDFVTMDEFAKYSKEIEKYFKYREMQRERLQRHKKCMFIHGDSGCGKTYFAKQFCESKGLSYYVSSSSNDPLDGYKGQNVVILDDLRGSSFSFSDLIKILDNNTSTLAKSRYYNKLLECDYIIITSVMPLEEFYSNLFEHESEPLPQLKRRCSIYIEIDRDRITVSKYSKSLKDYVVEGSMPNKCPFLENEEDNDDDTLVSDLLSLNKIDVPELTDDDIALYIGIMNGTFNDIEA